MAHYVTYFFYGVGVSVIPSIVYFVVCSAVSFFRIGLDLSAS